MRCASYVTDLCVSVHRRASSWDRSRAEDEEFHRRAQLPHGAGPVFQRRGVRRHPGVDPQGVRARAG